MRDTLQDVAATTHGGSAPPVTTRAVRKTRPTLTLRLNARALQGSMRREYATTPLLSKAVEYALATAARERERAINLRFEEAIAQARSTGFRVLPAAATGAIGETHVNFDTVMRAASMPRSHAHALQGGPRDLNATAQTPAKPLRNDREHVSRKTEWVDARRRQALLTDQNDKEASLKFLAESGYPTAANEMREAFSDISRHPNPYVTGAIHHSMMACESIARSMTGFAKPTLGQLTSRLPIEKSIATIIARLWGYASEHGRHCKEGQIVDPSDAKFVVDFALTICTRLAECKAVQ